MKIPECSDCIAIHICTLIGIGEKDCQDFHKVLESKLQSTSSTNKSSIQFPSKEECVVYFKELHGTQGYSVDQAYSDMYELIYRKQNT